MNCDRIHLWIYFAAAMLVCFGATRAQNSASTNIGEGAAISAPLRLFKITDLNFGGIIQGPNAGNVVISDRGERKFPGDPLGPSEYRGATSMAKTNASAASFSVSGEPSVSYSITTPATSTVSDGTHTMTVILDKPTGTNVSADGTSSKLSPDGMDSWSIGATLVVAAHQPSGVYTGSFTEIIAYQ